MPKFCRLERFSGGMSKQKKLSRLEKNKLAQQELDESLKKSLSGAEDVSDEKKLLEDKLKKSSWGLSEACFIAICGYPLGGWGHWNYRLNELESLAYQIFKDNAALKDSAEIYVIDFNVDIGDIYKQAYLAAKEGVFGAVHGLPLLWDVDPSKFIAWVLHLKNSENQPYVFHPSFIDWAKKQEAGSIQSSVKKLPGRKKNVVYYLDEYNLRLAQGMRCNTWEEEIVRLLDWGKRNGYSVPTDKTLKKSLTLEKFKSNEPIKTS
jgi:hypothetical protein